MGWDLVPEFQGLRPKCIILWINEWLDIFCDETDTYLSFRDMLVSSLGRRSWILVLRCVHFRDSISMCRLSYILKNNIFQGGLIWVSVYRIGPSNWIPPLPKYKKFWISHPTRTAWSSSEIYSWLGPKPQTSQFILTHLPHFSPPSPIPKDNRERERERERESK